MVIDLDTEFRIPIYRTKVRLVLCEDVTTYIKENKIDSEVRNYHAIVYEFYESLDVPYDILILLPNNVSSNTINHEIFHVGVAIMRNIGCTLTQSSEEAYAYLNEYLFRLVSNLIIKSRIEKREED